MSSNDELIRIVFALPFQSETNVNDLSTMNIKNLNSPPPDSFERENIDAAGKPTTGDSTGRRSASSQR
jgi:hypothetical protein